MNAGWFHLTSDDSPPLPAAGCLDVAGLASATRSPDCLIRVYEHKTRPDPALYAQHVRTLAASFPRATYQLANETNLQHEHFGGPAPEYAAWATHTAGLVNGVRLGVGAFSPGDAIPNTRPYSDVEGWKALGPFLNAHRTAVAVAHVYGRTLDELRACYHRCADNTPSHTAIVVGECNFGPAPDFRIDKDRWAREHFAPFLAFLDTQPRCRTALYFARRWESPDPWLSGGTPVDGAGTAVEAVLREFTPAAIKPPDIGQEPSVPPNKPILPDLCPFASYTPLTRNFDQDGTAPKIVVWHGTGGLGDPYNWWNRSVPANQAASADFWISKKGELKQYVKLVSQTSWSNGPLVRPDLSVPFLRWLVEYRKTHTGFSGNWWTVSVEMEKDPQNADALTAAQIKTGSRLARWFNTEFAIPLDRTHHLGHYQFDSVNRPFCPRFTSAEWAHLLAPAGHFDAHLAALRDQLWILKDQAWALGRTRLGDDVSEAVRRDKGEIP